MAKIEKMEIIVNETNRPRIADLISGFQGRAKERTISVEEIVASCALIEKKLGITKKAMEGTVADVDIHAQRFPNCYKGRPESTQFTVVFRGGKWRLIKVSRDYCRGEGKEYMLNLSETAKEAILEKASRLYQ